MEKIEYENKAKSKRKKHVLPLGLPVRACVHSLRTKEECYVIAIVFLGKSVEGKSLI